MRKRSDIGKGACIFVNVLMLFFLAVSQAAGVQVEEKWGWELVETRVNPYKKQTEFFGGGITPDWMTHRMHKGLHVKYTITETMMSYYKHKVERGRVYYDITLTVNFDKPDAVLVPGKTVWLTANVSGSGTGSDTSDIPAWKGKGGSMGLRFQYYIGKRGSWRPIKGFENTLSIGGSAEGPGKGDKRTGSFVVPTASQGGEFIVYASLWDCEACRVHWVYRAKRMGGQIDSIIDAQRVVGEVIMLQGVPEIKPAGRNEWIQLGFWPIRIGDEIRTDSDTAAWIRLNDQKSNVSSNASEIRISGNSRMIFRRRSSEHILKKEQETGPFLGLIKGVLRVILRMRQSRMRVICTGAVCSITGSDVMISHLPETKRTQAYVIEGHMDVTDTQTGNTVSLSAGQKLTVENGRLGKVQRLTRSEWNTLIDRNGLGDEGPVSTRVDIPSLNAMVTGVKFYEGGYDVIAKNQREYKTQFSKSTSRYIWWELNLKFPAPGRRIDFDIDATWHKPDGSVWIKQTKHAFIDSGWTNSSHYIGWGWKTPGNWKPGTYWVEFSIEGQKVATGTFEIE